MDYKPRDFEPKWKKYWEDHQIYKVDNNSEQPKFYVLDMFPYPSGAGLHVGHPLGYIASDIFARYKRMNGFNVLHPMGYDAFGLPAEQYALQHGVHPAISTNKNIDRYRQQLGNLGFSFDWDREVRTCEPSFYKWTQWIFLQLFEHFYDTEKDKAVPISILKEHFEQNGSQGIQAANSESISFTAQEWVEMTAKEQNDILMNYRLAYRKLTYVNWCEALGTVLANDEVKDGVSERGGFPVERKPMLQWSLRITAYAERLLNDLQDLEWSEAMKKMQSNWIGRSTGAQVFFEIEGSDRKIEIYTTRPDTIFGATFMVIAPEHDWVAEITTPNQEEEISQYLDYVKSRSERERMSETKEVTGAFTGSFAINPFNNEKIPIWIGEYVLKDYGTGCIMAVPADDERDHRFAEKYGLRIIDIIDKSMYEGASIEDKKGKMINSDFLNGMEVMDAIQAINDRLEEMGIGQPQVNYKLRDAIYSRQRYWGEPFPIVYDKDGVAYPLDISELPLELPDSNDFQPASGTTSPLGRIKEWVNLDNGYTRETDTMPGFAGSSWYFLRYMDPKNNEEFADQKAINYWKDVDLYVGGTEHAVGHLMYSRFWHKFLYDKGLVPTKEPFRKLINQGMIQGVIEFIFLEKQKEGSQYRFVSAELKETEERNGKEFIPIPVLVDYVSEYGSDNSHLDNEGIENFIGWRPEYNDAVFESPSGVFKNGNFTPKNGAVKMIMTTHSEVGKMSKSKYNVINPDDVVEQYGADCFRLYEMFLGPIEQAKPWDTQGIDGVSKFLRKFWGLFFDRNGNWLVKEGTPSKEELKILHTAIKKVSDDIERFSFNTCVSAFMVATNDFKKINSNNKLILEEMVRLIAPFAPHLAEELWYKLEGGGSVHHASYPILNEEYLIEDSIEYPISINGKKRATAEFPADASKEDLEKEAVANQDIQKWLEGKTVRKVIVVPKRMINIVVG